MGDNKVNSFKQHIKNQVGEYVTVLINSGNNCCRHKGVLCKVSEDFLILINNELKTEVALQAVVAVKRKVK